MTNSIFDRIKNHHLDEYLLAVRPFQQFDYAEMRALTNQAVRFYRGDADQREFMLANNALFQRWYASLDAGEPDYSVYSDPLFVAEAFACWVVYSRKYLLELRKFRGALDCLPKIRSVADLGCGIGYTTAALRELFPDALVYGTNIPSSFQYAFASWLGARRNFDMCPSASRQTDLIFASEYFEHHERPIQHLGEVLQRAVPHVLVIANSFGADSVGHFRVYKHGEQSYDNKAIGRHFNDALRYAGYSSLETGFWNDRPRVWVRDAKTGAGG